MNKIHQLSPEIVARIAAGEVIERPAYAVKELVENSIDAHATYITIQIEDSGLKKITIIDDGEGMSREDITESFKPHTTSKLDPSDDLIGIQSFGFRGEALASIASISQLTIKSKTANESTGTLIEINSGKVEKISPVGTASGTTIIIENLFTSVPARKKFLRSPRTEFRHIIDIVSELAMASPHIRFFLSHNGKTIFDLPQNQKILERIHAIMGSTTTNHLLPFSFEDSYIKISGFLARPQLTTKTTTKQYIFVNKRVVSDKLVSLAVKESYGTLLDNTSNPIFILFFTLPFEMVDVNVHPRKEQVSFANNKLIFDAIQKAVLQTLMQHNVTYQSTALPSLIQKKITHSYLGAKLKETVLEKTILEPHALYLQLNNLYIITQIKNGILILDQHAAHERVMFQKFSKAYANEKGKKEILQLAKPQHLTLSFSEYETLTEYQKLFVAMGFTINLNDDSCEIISIPKIFSDWNITKIITEMLEELAERGSVKTVDSQSHKMLQYLACRGAIMSGDTLSQEQMKELVYELERTENNTTCPHGRPTKWIISHNQLDTLFERT